MGGKAGDVTLDLGYADGVEFLFGLTGLSGTQGARSFEWPKSKHSARCPRV